MTDMDARALDRELKKGAAELLILSLLEVRARHGYEISKLIQTRSGGVVLFHIDSLYPLLYRLEERGWIQGRWVEKAGERRRRYYQLTGEGAKCSPDSATPGTRSSTPCGASPAASMREGLKGPLTCAPAWPACGSLRRARRRLSKSCRSISTIGCEELDCRLAATARIRDGAGDLVELENTPAGSTSQLATLRQAHMRDAPPPGLPARQGSVRRPLAGSALHGSHARLGSPASRWWPSSRWRSASA